MKRMTIVATLAAFVYVLSWLMPVFAGGTTLAKGSVPGWEALRYALSPIWEYQGLSGRAENFNALISVISGLSNLWFVVALAALLLRRRGYHPGIFWGLALSVLVNVLWFVLANERGDLRIGYYLWLGSFVVLAVAARFRWAEAARPGALGTLKN